VILKLYSVVVSIYSVPEMVSNILTEDILGHHSLAVVVGLLKLQFEEIVEDRENLGLSALYLEASDCVQELLLADKAGLVPAILLQELSSIKYVLQEKTQEEI